MVLTTQRVTSRVLPSHVTFQLAMPPVAMPFIAPGTWRMGEPCGGHSHLGFLHKDLFDLKSLGPPELPFFLSTEEHYNASVRIK